MRLSWYPLIALVVVLLAGLPASAQQEKTRTIPFEGPQFFCHILHYFGLQPIDSLEDAEEDPRNSIVIIFGNPRQSKLDRFMGSRADRYLKQGGNLLVASDYSLYVSGVNATITPARVRQGEKHQAFRGEESCSFIEFGNPQLPGLDIGGDHPLFQLLSKRVATNCPTWINVGKSGSKNFRVLASFPRSAQADQDRLLSPTAVAPKGSKGKAPPVIPSTLSPTPAILPYMVGSPSGAAPDGRALVIAGHGMFVNGMMVQKDNDNFQFALNIVAWLQKGSQGSRTRTFMVIDGEVITDFDMNLTPPPEIPIPTVKHINRLLRGLESERFLQRVLHDMFGAFMNRFVSILLGVATFVVLLYGAKKVMDARFHAETLVPTVVGVAPKSDPAAPLKERSEARALAGGTAVECQALARDWLHQTFGVSPDQWLPDAQVSFSLRGYFWPWTLSRQAAFVLALARSPSDSLLSRGSFVKFVQALRDLTLAYQKGRLALLVDGKEVN